MIDLIRDVWGWSGIRPAELVWINAFGNLIVKDEAGAYRRICPEEISCEVVADSEETYLSLLMDDELLRDWEMTSLVEEARARVGPLPDGHAYCFKILPIIGGEYGGENLSSISLRGLHAFCSQLAEQTKDLPDGSQIRISVDE